MTQPSTAPVPLPLSTLLSQALVAFIIEFDDEFEHQMPHRTTNHGRTPGAAHAPWLVSMVMWTWILQFVPTGGISVSMLQSRVGATNTVMQSWLRRLSAWGYLVVAPNSADTQPGPPRSDWIVRPTRAGAQAQEVWRPLAGIVEERWGERFGREAVANIRSALESLLQQIDRNLPDNLPILGYGLFTASKEQEWQIPSDRDESGDSRLPLPALLSRVLVAFASEYEQEAPVSLAISADVLRVLDQVGVPLRDLPMRTGVSKEAVAIAMSYLESRHLAVTEVDPAGGRIKVARLTAPGEEAKALGESVLGAVETRWQAQFGSDTVRALRVSLEQVVEGEPGERSPLFRGLESYPDGWRAAVPQPLTLPHYPMILHRGGFPDGS